VIISKALVVGAYQRKLEELACLPDITLTAIVPLSWRDRRGQVRLTRAHTVGYELIAAPLVLNGSYHLHFYPTLGSLLRRIRPHVVHADEEPYNLAAWQMLRQARSVGATGLFFTWQNLLRRYPWPFRILEQASYRLAGQAIAGNTAAAEVLRAKGYHGPIAIIPQFGVDPDIFSPAQTEHAAGRPFAIGYAGGLVPEKGVGLLLEACAGLSGRDWVLEIVGSGPERGRLRRQAAALGQMDRVRFLGQQPSTALPEIYRRWHVLALPSISRPNWIEQFGRVLIEAMACGTPVIGSTCGEIPNVIGDAGLIFPEGDVNALRAALARLAADETLRGALAAAGRQRVLTQFTQTQVAAATYRVYQEMVSS
jgi:glycosyltransferase involved in cell wall biosynthesis